MLRNKILSPKPDGLNLDTNPYSVGVKLCLLNTYSVIAYFGVLIYIILSIFYLVNYSWMRNGCEEQRNLWLYLCLCQVSLFTCSVITVIIEGIYSAKMYLLLTREILIILASLSFGSYGSGVLAKANDNNIKKNCENLTPNNFDDLVLVSMILAWIIFLYSIIKLFFVALSGCQWLTKKPQYVHLDDQEHHHHDPDLIIGKNKQDNDNNDDNDNDNNNNNNSNNNDNNNEDKKYEENNNNTNKKKPSGNFGHFGDRIWDNQYHSDITDDEEFQNQQNQQLQNQLNQLNQKRHTVQFGNPQQQQIYQQYMSSIQKQQHDNNNNNNNNDDDDDQNNNIELGATSSPQQQYMGTKDKLKTSSTTHSGVLTRRNINTNE